METRIVEGVTNGRKTFRVVLLNDAEKVQKVLFTADAPEDDQAECLTAGFQAMLWREGFKAGVHHACNRLEKIVKAWKPNG